MKRRLLGVVVAIATAMALTIPVGAADLHPSHVNTECPEGEGFVVLHFVQNKIPVGTAAGTITVVLQNNGTIVQLADRVNRRNQHWTINLSGGDKVLSASTNISGGEPATMLVLSDWDCKGTTTTSKGTTSSTD